MNKTAVFFGVVIFIIISWLVGFVDNLQNDVDITYGFNEKAIVSGDKKNYKVDSSGYEILQLTKLSLKEQKELWNKSSLKEDMLQLFPNFSEIKYFINSRIEDNGSFKSDLLAHVERVEEDYIGGEMTENKAKSILSNL